jgi:hypothetical protein
MRFLRKPSGLTGLANEFGTLIRILLLGLTILALILIIVYR